MKTEHHEVQQCRVLAAARYSGSHFGKLKPLCFRGACVTSMLFLWQSRLRSAQFAHWRATFVKTAVGFREQNKTKKKGRRKGRGWLLSCFTAQVQGTHWKSPLSVTSLRVLLLCATGGMWCPQRETDAEPDNWHRMGVLVSSTSTIKDTQLLLFYLLPARKRKWEVEGG